MKSTILHVGPHKTGTTYLQRCFSHHRAALRARGVVVPAAWEHARNNPSHTGLVRALGEGGDLTRAASVIEEVFAEARDGDRLLISAEDLSALRTEALQRLRTLLAGSDVVVVFYIRRWSDLLPSGWQENVKQGQAVGFPEFLANHARNPEGSPIFNYELKLLNLMQVFGRQAVRLVCYSALCDADQDIFTHFAAQFLQCEGLGPPPGKQEVNASRDVRQIELLRRLNGLNLEQTGRRSPALRRRLDALWSRGDADQILAAMGSSRRTMLFNDNFPALHRLHEELRQRYTANLVQPCPSKLFFEPKLREIPYVSEEYLMRPGVVEAIHDIYRQVAGDP